MIDAETFKRCSTLRKYLVYKEDRPIFTCILKHFPDNTIGITIIEGTMKGYSIAHHDLWRFYGESYALKDCGEAPMVASLKIATDPGRPRPQPKVGDSDSDRGFASGGPRTPE